MIEDLKQVDNCKEVVRGYQNGRVGKRELIRSLSAAILETPKRFGYAGNRDMIHDYYAAVLGKIDKILSKYKPTDEHAFDAWFKKVLKNDFINYAKSLKRKDFGILQSGYNENFAVPVDESASVKINFPKLSKNEFKIIDYKYGVSKEYSDNKTRSMEINENFERKINLEAKLSFNYIKLLKVQRDQMNETEKERLEELKRKEEKIRVVRENIKSLYDAAYIYPSSYQIGRNLGLNRNTVGAYMNRIRKKFAEQGVKQTVVFQ
ncbi:MAG TPA: hypothetical protein PK385_07360 [Spirochaetota bacterium]|nr:hypothetical protein [Spirochaetota bacterium]HOS32697.1 hypothetical protein [Spirochaetota bacterium]HOS55861.1 hypothetical protein [Spirochaetota bacterium]HQF78428.1 hypothetical protein [Spirochaetota bacterium]HQH31186.1 hypothetical protein [Spirochaetota bacterium]